MLNISKAFGSFSVNDIQKAREFYGMCGRHEISENLAPAFAYGNLLIGGVFRDVRQLVGVNRVTQKKCDQGQCLPRHNLIPRAE